MAHATCATAEVVAALPFGTVLDTTAQPDDPTVPDDYCGSSNSYNAYWLTWTAPLDGSVRHVVATLGGLDQSTVTVFTGTCGALVLLDGRVFHPDPCVYVGSPLGWDVVPGETYFFLITSFAPGGEAALPFDLVIGTPEGAFCTTLTCESPAEPTITEMAIACATLILTVTGADLVPDAEITLTGPDGDVPFTLISQSPTSRVLQLDPMFESGTYCVTVGASNTFCTDLACGRPGCVLGNPAAVVGSDGCVSDL